ncbi:MAG: hypothetical protein IPP71_17885 [Bacteroidetes bacterium]|nr:hypothetical protein [Bacteroidota bacterium]
MRMLLEILTAQLGFKSKRFTIVWIYCTFFILFSNQNVQAQEIKASAKVDTTSIVIGNQFILDLSVTHPSNINPEWPAVADTFSLLEVVQRSGIDTPSSN